MSTPTRARWLIKELENFPVLQDLETATGIKKLYLLSFIGPFFVMARALHCPPNLVCNLAGFVYPTVASIRAIESKSRMDDTQWLTYWTVFAVFTLIEGLFLKSLLQAFPFFWAFKFGFLVWAQAPSSKGAVFVYSHLLAPFLKNHSVVPSPNQAQQ